MKENNKIQQQKKKMVKEQKSGCHQLGDHQDLVIEILSRLPVKSLTRFKCVCKHWQSLIQKDQFFIDLHFSRSKAAAGTFSLIHVRKPYVIHGMRLLPVELVLASEEDGRVKVRYARGWKVWEQPSRFDHRICTLDGLICLMDTQNNCARIENSSTRESTPWIKTQYEVPLSHKRLTKHVFGYDPATKEYKVLALWSLFETGMESVVSEVMTVRQNVWRRIDGIPSISPPYTVLSSVYVNGSIYLLFGHYTNDAYAQTIVEFNVGSEKFITVETVAPSTHLMELHGRLCLVIQDIQDGTYGSIKMRILYNHGEDVVQDKKSKTTTDSSNTRMSTSVAAGSNNYRWVEEETLSLPYYHRRLNSIRHIPGTNLIIIISSGRSRHYIWNKKNNVIALDSIEMSSPLGGETEITEFDIFTPNLLRVN